MSEISIEERLYQLLPAVHRIRDAAHGEPLRALLAILEREFAALREDTQGLYDDWFIETCKEWVVPYLGDSLGAQLVRSIHAEGFSQRAFVANTLRYRRRKGTAAVLEQLARDVTGWPARVVEYFERLATTQQLGHVRLHAPATASLRHADRLELAGGPFGAECHTLEVRSIARGCGRFNIPNIGLHLWRLRAYPLQRADARPLSAAGVDAGRYTFDPLGASGPLFNLPRAETEITHLAEERDVPARLRRRALYAELSETGAAAPADGWFGLQPVLRVRRVDAGGERELLPAELCICDLEGDDPSIDWPRPEPPIEVNVDPETGRLAFRSPAPEAVLVDYAYGFSADIGGGPYERRSTVPERLDVPVGLVRGMFQHGVSKAEAAVGDERIHDSLASAISAWNFDALAAFSSAASLDRVIVVMDSRSYLEDLTRAKGHCIVVPPGSRLRLIAARWPTQSDPADPDVQLRSEGRLDASGVRPHLRGDIEVLPIEDPNVQRSGGTLEVDGLLIEGSLTVLPGTLGSLALRHATLVPGLGGLRVAANPGLELELTRCILDGVSLANAAKSVRVTDCIVDRGARRIAPVVSANGSLAETPLARVLSRLAADLDPAAVLAALSALPNLVIAWNPTPAERSIAAHEADLEIRTSTLLGPTSGRKLEGSESLFAERVEVQIVQAGCLRYSYAPPSSLTPQRFRCQPDLAREAARAAARDAGVQFTLADLAATDRRVRPLFTSTSYGHPAYGQLARGAAQELATGAEDGSEMGVFNVLKQAHRESNLRAALEQYLRFGLDAGLFFVT